MLGYVILTFVLCVVCFFGGFITASLLAANKHTEIATEAYEIGYDHGVEVGIKERIRTTK